MSDAFRLQIISPAAVVIDGHVAMVEVPGLEGDFGVLAHHAPFFSMLRPGVIKVHYQDNVVRSYFAATGYADVSETGTTIVSDHIQEMTDIKLGDAQEALLAAKEALSTAHTDEDKRAAEKLVSTATALVMAVAA